MSKSTKPAARRTSGSGRPPAESLVLASVPRPMPPKHLSAFEMDAVAPAPDLWAWAKEAFIQPRALLRNEDHAHLMSASVGFLWTNVANVKQGRAILGTAQLGNPSGSDAWAKARQAQQLREWFPAMPTPTGYPDFLITIYAPFWTDCKDADACALLEHELYHCAQKRDLFGSYAFTKDGRPKWAIRGHDVEEFVGVTRRYGAGAIDGSVQRLVVVAIEGPHLAPSDIACACGTCSK